MAFGCALFIQQGRKMYLFVFVIFFSAILGIYTQTFLLGASRAEARRHSSAELMYLWHQEAYAQAAEAHKNLVAGPSLFGGTTFCATSKASSQPSTASDCNALTTLSANFTSDARLNTVAYVTSGHTYLVTYIVNDANGFARTGYTAGEISKQFKNSTNIPNWMYGEVMSGTCGGVMSNFIFTSALVNGQIVCYPTKDSSGVTFVPDGAIGLVSVLQ